MPTATPRPSAARRSWLLAAALLTLLLLPTAARAAGWATGPIYAGNATGGFPGVASDRDGATTLAWIEGDIRAGTATAHAQRTAADGTAGPQLTLGDAVLGDRARAAAAPSGASAVAWVTPNPAGSTSTVSLAAIGRDGSAGPTRALFTGDGVGFSDVDLGIDDTGNAVVTWVATNPDTAATAVMARRVTADGTLGRLVAIDGVRDGEAHPRVAVAPDGAAFLTWRQDTAPSVTAVWGAHLTVDGALDGAPSRLSTAGADSDGAQIAASPFGAAVAWSEVEASGSSVHVARLRATGGLLASVQEVSTADADQNGDPGVALAPDGTATVAWSPDSTASSGPDSDVVLRRIGADGNAGPVQTLSSTSLLTQASALPFVAGGADGSVTVAWIELGLPFGYTLTGRRIAADGTVRERAAITPILPMFGPSPDGFAALATDGSGGATVAWVTVTDLSSPSASLSTATAQYDEAPPKVDASVPATVTLGTDATLSAVTRDRSGIKELWWEFGDDSGSRRAAVRHRYADPGTYTVTLTVTDKADNTTTVTRQVTVVAPAPRAERVSAALKLTKVSRKGAKVTVAGTLDKRAGGKVTIAYAQKIGRRSLSKRVTAKIANGRFGATLKLTGALANARGGKATVNVSYGGDADTNTASAKRTVANPKKAARTRRR